MSLQVRRWRQPTWPRPSSSAVEAACMETPRSTQREVRLQDMGGHRRALRGCPWAGGTADAGCCGPCLARPSILPSFRSLSWGSGLTALDCHPLGQSPHCWRTQTRSEREATERHSVDSDIVLHRNSKGAVLALKRWRAVCPQAALAVVQPTCP